MQEKGAASPSAPAAPRLANVLLLAAVAATVVHLGTVVVHVGQLTATAASDAAGTGGSSMLAHDAGVAHGSDAGDDELVHGNILVMPDVDAGGSKHLREVAAAAARRLGGGPAPTLAAEKRGTFADFMMAKGTAGGGGGGGGAAGRVGSVPVVEYPAVQNVTSLDWYHRHFNDTAYRAPSTQREVFWGRPKVHGRCAKLIFAIRGSGFQLMTMHGPTLSVEQKLVETLVGFDERRRIQSAEQRQATTGRCASARGSANTTSHPHRLVMDLGVNDGEDTATWYSVYGRANASCTTYVLLEPQAAYAHNIHCAVEAHYLGSKLGVFPVRRVLGTGEVLPLPEGQTAAPGAERATAVPARYVPAPCGNLTLEEWAAIAGKALGGVSLVDATWHVFNKTPTQSAPPPPPPPSSGGLSDRRIMYFKAAAATMPNQHLNQVVMSGSGEQAAVVVSSKEKSGGTAAEKAAAAAVAEGATTTLLSLSEVFQQLTMGRSIASGGDGATAGASGTPMSPKTTVQTLAANPSRISLLKIDCEGADPSIVMGAWELFAAQRVDMLVIEVHKNNYMFEGAFPYNYTEAVAMLRFYGYRTFLVGFFHAFDSFVFMEIDSAFMMLWRPNLETIVAFPAVPLDGQPFLLYQPGVAKRMTKKMITGFFIASSRMNVETSNYWGRVRNEGHYMGCLMNVYLVRCPVCGGERKLVSKKKYGG